MRWWRLGLVSLLIAAGCGGEAAPGGQSLPLDQPRPGPAGPTTTSLAESATTAPGTTPPLEAGAIVTATGVPVAVLAQVGSGYLVRTPCGAQELLTGGTPLGPVEVVIDPGHGGEVDTGAVGPNGLREADLNLALSRLLAEELEERGVRTILTRAGDYATSLSVRAELADHLGARALVSIHHNSPTPGPSSRPGTEVYVQSGSEESRRLGGLIWQRLVGSLSRFDVQWSAAPDAGVLTVLNTRGSDAYGMVRSPETVSVLVEAGYLSHRPEAELFATAEYRRVASLALADAIVAYLESNTSGSGFIPEPRTFNPQPGISRSVCQDPALE